MSEQRNEINETAIQWRVRQDQGDLTAAEREELDTWLGADPRHLGAFLRAQSIWAGLDRLAILPSHSTQAAPWYLNWRWTSSVGAGIAAMAASVIFVVFYWSSALNIETPVGEIRRVPLSDGSVATVNTDSSVDVAIKQDVREVTLEKGEVWFKVAKDKSRPFVVSAGNVRVRAVGTAFSVRRRADGADILVTEGVVEVWNTSAEATKKRVNSGLKVFVSDIAPPSDPVKPPTEIEHQLAWRSGEIVLDGETLSEAAEEFNRYNQRKITIDPSLRNRQLVGLFRVDEPETFARAAAQSLKATAIEQPREIHLSPAQK